MNMQAYPGSLSLREALGVYFEENDFGADGGYGDKWVKLKLGPLPLAFPNLEGRAPCASTISTIS